MTSQEHERERDQTHSNWYIPSAPRVNYSLLVMASAGMMKMATRDDFPSLAGYWKPSRWVFRRYRELRWRSGSSMFISGVSSMYRILQRWNHAQRSYESPTSQQAMTPLGRTLMACGPGVAPLRWFFTPILLIWSRKNHEKVLGDSENFHFLHKNNTR